MCRFLASETVYSAPCFVPSRKAPFGYDRQLSLLNRSYLPYFP
jgi:hypothetical protein